MVNPADPRHFVYAVFIRLTAAGSAQTLPIWRARSYASLGNGVRMRSILVGATNIRPRLISVLGEHAPQQTFHEA